MTDAPSKQSDLSDQSCFQWIIHADKKWTRRIYQITNSKRRKLFTRASNIFMKVLEYSCHGVPWLVWTFYHIYSSPWGGEDQAFYVNLLAGLLLDLCVVGLMKVIFKRPRPSYNVDDMYGSVAIDKHAFPSGHATRALLLMCIYWTVYTQLGMRTFLLFWAYWVCLSRVLLGRHHLGDVVLGVVIGCGVAFFLFHVVWLSPDTISSLLVILGLKGGSDKATE